MNQPQFIAVVPANIVVESQLQAAGLQLAAPDQATHILLPDPAGESLAAVSAGPLRRGQTAIALASAPATLADLVAARQSIELAGARFAFIPTITVSEPVRVMREAMATGEAGRIVAMQCDCFDHRQDAWVMVERAVALLTTLAGTPATSVTAQMSGSGNTSVIAATLRFSGMQAQLMAGCGRPAIRAMIAGEQGSIAWDGQSVVMAPSGSRISAAMEDSPAIAVKAALAGELGSGIAIAVTVEAIRSAVATAAPASPAEESWRATGVTIHPTAVVDEGAAIGRGSKIWHFSHILHGVRIGRSVNIGQNVVVGPDVDVGDNCRIQNNVSLYKGVTLESGVFCGPSCVFTNVNNPRAEIERKSEFLTTLVRQGATIGANATIVCGHTLGRYSFIAAGAVVAGDVPDFALMAGVPARRIGWMSRAGGRLGADLVCPIDGSRYRLDGNGNLEEDT